MAGASRSSQALAQVVLYQRFAGCQAIAESLRVAPRSFMMRDFFGPFAQKKVFL
jgi:hypothetical protein